MTKRANGEGSYIHIVPTICEKCKDFSTCVKRKDPYSRCRRRDQSDHWEYYYYVRTIEGKLKRQKIQSKNRKDLIARVDQMHMDSNAAVDAITVGQWCDRWLDAILPGTIRDSTLISYKHMLSYIPENIRKKKLSKLSPIDLQKLFTDLKINGSKKKGDRLSSTTVRSVRSTLITCFQSAIDNGFITVNVAKKTKPPLNDDRREISFLTEDEILKLLEVADSGEYYEADEETMDDEGIRYLIKQWSMLIRLTLATGMRRGEVFGLTWQKVDFHKNFISIEANLQNGKMVKPKTKYSIRKISVDADTMKQLLEWQEYQQQFAYDLDDLYHNKYGTVFTGVFGKPCQVDNFRERVFDRMITKSGLPETITFHSLRHTHATQLLASGVDAKTVSKRLGHSSVAFTLQTYVHVLPEVERNAADVMGAIMAGKKPNETT